MASQQEGNPPSIIRIQTLREAARIARGMECYKAASVQEVSEFLDKLANANERERMALWCDPSEGEIEVHGRRVKEGSSPALAARQRKGHQMEEQYLVWSHEHGAWWRPNRAGYTVHLEDAGLYSRDEAISICAESRDGWGMRQDVPSEIPVRGGDAAACRLMASVR